LCFRNYSTLLQLEGVHDAPERAKKGKMIDIYSIRESEGEKIIQKNEETDKDGDCGERRKYKIIEARLKRRHHRTDILGDS